MNKGIPHLSLLFLLFISSCAGRDAVTILFDETADSRSPTIQELRYVGQSPLSSQILIFEIALTSATPKISDGLIKVLVVGSSEKEILIPLKPVFFQNGFGPNSQQAKLQFPLELKLASHTCEQGCVFWLVFVVLDNAGLQSNKAIVRLLAEKT